MTDKQLDVLDYLRSQQVPRTVKEIGAGAKLKAPYPYNTLNLLIEKGMARLVELPCRPPMYEAVKK